MVLWVPVATAAIVNQSNMLLRQLIFVCVSVAAQMGKVLWQSGAHGYKKSGCTTNHTQEIHWEGKSQDRGCLCLGENQQTAEQKMGLCKDFGDRGNFPGWPGVGGIMWPDLGASSGIGGIFFLCRAGPGPSSTLRG